MSEPPRIEWTALAAVEWTDAGYRLWLGSQTDPSATVKSSLRLEWADGMVLATPTGPTPPSTRLARNTTLIFDPHVPVGPYCYEAG